MLDEFDQRALAYLVVRHCAQLEMPARLQAFPALVGLKIYNSTLVSWPEDAALTDRHHPKMRFVDMVKATMGALPPGLMAPDFPRKLRRVRWCDVHFESLPDDLDTKWPKRMSLFLELTNLTSVPSVLARMDIDGFSLAGNQIATIPDGLLVDQHYSFLVLSGNPLSKLPADFSTTAGLWELYVDSTQFAELPAWIDADFVANTIFYAGGSPFCVEIARKMAQSLPLTAVETGTDCTVFDLNRLTIYPLLTEIADNPP